MNSGLQVYSEQNKLAQWAQMVAQQESLFVEVTPVQPVVIGSVAVTM